MMNPTSCLVSLPRVPIVLVYFVIYKKYTKYKKIKKFAILRIFCWYLCPGSLCCNYYYSLFSTLEALFPPKNVENTVSIVIVVVENGSNVCIGRPIMSSNPKALLNQFDRLLRNYDDANKGKKPKQQQNGFRDTSIITGQKYIRQTGDTEHSDKTKQTTKSTDPQKASKTGP